VSYLNNVVEEDHRFIKERIAAILGFRSIEGALNTIERSEAMRTIRKAQVRWLSKDDVLGQRASSFILVRHRRLKLIFAPQTPDALVRRHLRQSPRECLMRLGFGRLQQLDVLHSF
jgi:hypothetical protein